MTSDPAGGDHGHAAMAERMADLATAQPGYLGIESAPGPDGFGITVSYWESDQEAGVNRWYEPYELTAWTAP